MISKDAEPEPMIVAALKTTAGTSPSSRILATRSRDRMCWDSVDRSSTGGCRPER